MSGYDFKGMLSRVRHQANYVQNNVLKSNEDTMSNNSKQNYTGEPSAN